MVTSMTYSNTLPRQYLRYDFTYEEQRHRGRIVLDEESSPNLTIFFDEHNLEMTFVKRIRHKGAKIILNIVLDDDANKEPFKVVTSAWVCVYKDDNLIASFEPNCWLYIDEENESHNTCKGTFYVENPNDRGCELCANQHRCRRKMKSRFS